MFEDRAHPGGARHLALIGPTASGKSRFALELASSLPAIEIISLDSMQVYRGFDIGTAKPTHAEQAAVVHHLIDVVDPHEPWSVRETQRRATEVLGEIEARGGRALFVGGTGLYVQAVVDQFKIPPQNEELRAKIEADLETDDGLAAGYQRLLELDVDAAQLIEPTNTRRIARALEVIELTGEPFSQAGGGIKRYSTPALDVALLGIDTGSARDQRIDERLDLMLNAGWLEEVRELSNLEWSTTAQAAIGYRELAEVVRGERPIADAREAIALRTRQFARRQHRWFRRDPRIIWAEPSKLPHVRDEILARWS
ncbi:MAG: tRNA (adenosine(37)-N6)-dimethylallyltransferase MiaA [Acidimicrobiia bacterium]